MQIRFAIVVLVTSFICDVATMFVVPVTSLSSELLEALFTSLLTSVVLWFLGLRPIMQLKSRLVDAERAINSTDEGYWVLDLDGNFMHVNDAYCSMMGYSKAELLTMKISDLERRATQEQIKKQIRRIIWSGNQRFETQHRHADGSWVDLEITVTAIDKQHVVAFLRDITQKKLAEKRIQELAYSDNVTGLANRNYFEKYIAEIHAVSPTQSYTAVILLDLDNFKRLNDTRGHLEGDKVLRQMATLISSHIPAGNVAFRLGGDEFAIILNDLPRDGFRADTQALELAEKIRYAIEGVVTAGEFQFKLSVSIGIAISRIHQVSLENLLKKADIALYRAKEAGRNQCFLFKDQMQVALELKARLETELGNAIINDQLVPYLQPQFDRNRHVVGAEILLRWVHPELGFIRPIDFIPVAEDSGHIIPIGNWLIEYACQQLSLWKSNAITAHLQLAVNVSVVQFQHAKFIEHIENLLDQYQFERALLKLELTESIALSNIEAAIKKMTAIRKLGLSLSMDDFGTGHASLSNLRNLPINQLKVDKSFVNNIVNEPRDVAVARCIITVGTELGMEVIAEGVETEYQRALLESLGCHLFQGYLYSPAVPLSDFELIVQHASLTESTDLDRA